jgi:uncharacterized membrane protein
LSKKYHNQVDVRKEIKMNKAMTWLYGLGLGAGLMYMFDPARGRRRRALLRDQTVRAWRRSGDLVDKATRDLQNRTSGLAAEARAMVSRDSAPDVVLAERVRAALGRAVSHPSSISVRVNEGHVTLSGPILAHEVDGLLAQVRSVRGVAGVENGLQVYKQPGDVPGLQGGAGRREPEFELFQENWAPGIRLLATLGGGTLAVSSLLRGGLLGVLGSLFGLGLLARGLANRPFRRLVGMTGGRGAVDLHKTINVNAPVEEVFAFWENFENFPRFMSHVREVKNRGNDLSHWVVDGPAGTTLEWDAVITQVVPNKVLAWKSMPGSAVGHAGIVHFGPGQDGGTQVDIQMSYNPPAGAVGHAVASFFGSNPKQLMDEDLIRFKSLLEQGKTTADGRTVTRERVRHQAQEAPA